MNVREKLREFVTVLEEKGTQNLENKQVDYAYFISVDDVKKIHVPKGGKPFVKFENLFLEKLFTLHFSDDKLDVPFFSSKLFGLLEPLIPILEQLSRMDILSYWILKISLDTKTEKEEDIILSILSLEHKQDFFSCVGHTIYKNLYKKQFSREFVIHKLLIFPEPKNNETSFKNYRLSLLQFFLALQKETEKIAEKDLVSLVFVWNENLLCSYTTGKYYIILDDEFIEKGSHLSLTYPEHFYNLSKHFLNRIQNGWLIKHGSLDLQKKYWYALTASFFVKGDFPTSMSLFISHFVWLEYLSIGGLEFHQNGILFSREFFKEVYEKEIEDFWSKSSREDLLSKILKEI